MTVALRTSGAPKNVTGVAVRVGGAPKTVTEGLIRDGGVLRQFYATLAVGVSNTQVLGRGNSATVIPITSAAVTATPEGAIGKTSYAWTRADSDPHPWTINSPTEPTTTFTTDCDQGEHFQATFICTITDQSGQVLASAPVTADCANIFYGGGYKGSAPPAPGTYYP